MNDELRAALDKLDAALAEARAAMEPEPRCPNCGSTRKFRQDDKGRWLCDHCGYHAPAPQPQPPCVVEKPPRGVVVQCGGRDIRLATIDEIGAGVCPGAGPRLYVKLGSCLSWTTTPIADIIAQAAVPNIELPPVTVDAGRDWTAITKAVASAGTDGLVYTIHGEADGGPVNMMFSPLTPAQVVALCALAGWPKPEVRMVCTYTDGAPCEVDPENISGVGVARHATTIETNAPLADGSCVHHVREPVPVVQRMIDACKESE